MGRREGLGLPHLVRHAGGGGLKAELIFEGLDTFTAVAVNGQTVLRTDNIFVTHRADVAGLLRARGDNELVIAFDAAYLRDWDVVNRHPRHRWGCWNGDASRLAVRKAQYHWVRQPPVQAPSQPSPPD